MTPEQALALLFQAARLAPLNGDSHDQIKQAAQILQEALKPKDKKDGKQ